MSILEAGQAAPAFTLPNGEGETVSLADFAGKKKVVLYFYPKDDTPGCTQEACDFRDNLSRLEAKDAVVLGVSRDGIKSHKRFFDKFELTFPLLSDEDSTVCNAYGVIAEKNMYGKKVLGVVRSTFVIGKDGTIKKVFPKVKVHGHVEEVLEALDQA